jgi:diaminopimelate decarboxylase
MYYIIKLDTMPVNLKINNEEIKNLVSKYGTPLQIYDGDLMIENFNNFLDIMSGKFKSFKQYFAVKALPNPYILKLLVDNGSYLDCSSLSELKLAEMIGVEGESIMFTSNYTSKEDLAYALKLNAIINLDDISLIETLKDTMPELICFRLNPGMGKTDSETKSNVLGGPDAKFGIADFQIVEAYKKAKEYGAKRFGLHIMTGSNVMNPEYWNDLISVLYYHINEIQKTNDIKLEFINIGGGIGIPYRQEQEKININEFSEILLNAINREQTKYNLQNIKLYMENGRFITGPYGWLLAKCNVIKESYSTYYGLDACMSNLMRPGMYGAYHHITILGKTENVQKANVVGTLCENNDWFAKDRELPKAEVGDVFVIHDTGAHSHSMGFQYNGKLRAPEVLIYKGNNFLIRRREVFEDYISTCETRLINHIKL